ncbi:MAG: acyl dehydratase [Desulfovibrio sp.]|nr:MAG: acyl dehydratase [Desulfovibrio sp.]
MATIYLDDLEKHKHLDCRPILMTKSAIVDFAREFDPQPFHIDEGAAGQSMFNGLVASSLHTLSACTRVVVEAQQGVAVMSGVGMEEVKMFLPVRPGDTFTVQAEWTDLRPSRSKPDRGFATLKCSVANQRGEQVLEYGYRYLIARNVEN